MSERKLIAVHSRNNGIWEVRCPVCDKVLKSGESAVIVEQDGHKHAVLDPNTISCCGRVLMPVLLFKDHNEFYTAVAAMKQDEPLHIYQGTDILLKTRTHCMWRTDLTAAN